MSTNVTEPNINQKSSIEYIKSNFQLHAFETEIENDKICFQVIKMKDSLYLWIGNKNKPMLLNISLAMNTQYENSPVATKLLGDDTEMESKNIASRLSKRLSKAVYVSCNVEETRLSLPIIEKRLSEEIKKNPDKF